MFYNSITRYRSEDYAMSEDELKLMNAMKDPDKLEIIIRFLKEEGVLSDAPAKAAERR